MSELIKKSLQVILENQSPSGAFIASPNFPTYAFCWFRDSAYIAFALDLYGEYTAAARFHSWAAENICKREGIVQRALQCTAAGQIPGDKDILHTRYTLEGKENTATSWENFQLDGFGTWLWALTEHQRLSKQSIPSDWLDAARIVADYIAGLWHLPCFDCWEEFNGKIHPHTLAAIYGGLQAYGKLTGDKRDVTTTAILNFVMENAVVDGYLQKFLGNSQVDSSLLGLSTPYRMIQPTDPIMLRTAQKIEADLCDGGVKRYLTDTYYGGGQWILLAAWLGWYWTEIGDTDKAWRLRQWIEAQADLQGWLPEQVAVKLNDESMLQPWIERWGQSAHPLLWSHAQYLILCKALENHIS